jgi:hypothetical protein
VAGTTWIQDWYKEPCVQLSWRLVATSLDGEPLMLTTNAFIVPQLLLLMAFTGARGLLGKWFFHVNDRMIVCDVNHLNHHAPGF